MFNLWGFLFASFRKTDTINAFKSSLWEVTHVVLHFSMLLLVSSMVVSLERATWSSCCQTYLLLPYHIIHP